MPPSSVATPGQRIADPSEGVIRRARRDKRQPMVFDQRLKCYRLPAAAFEPRLPQNRPNLRHHDKYLSVNIESSLLNDGLSLDWGCDHDRFYAGKLLVASVEAAELTVSWEPVDDEEPMNPHHGAINGVVEMFYRDQEQYELTLSRLSDASVVLSACLPSI